MSAVMPPVFVTWSQRWEMDQYIDHYLRIRGLSGLEDARERIEATLMLYPGNAPMTKADLDFFLDANLRRG